MTHTAYHPTDTYPRPASVSGIASTPLLMLDLSSGLGGASEPMLNRGWQVIRVDNDPAMPANIIADIRNWSWKGPRPHLLWASPPCTEFTRSILPWIPHQQPPDMSIVEAVCRIVWETQPYFWCIENVRGALRPFKPILGRPRAIYGPIFLWGYFPDLGSLRTLPWKTRLSGRQKTARAKIPRILGERLAIAIEMQPQLLCELSHKGQ